MLQKALCSPFITVKGFRLTACPCHTHPLTRALTGSGQSLPQGGARTGAHSAQSGNSLAIPFVTVQSMRLWKKWKTIPARYISTAMTISGAEILNGPLNYLQRFQRVAKNGGTGSVTCAHPSPLKEMKC